MLFSDGFWDFSLHWYVGLSWFFFHWIFIFFLIGFDAHNLSLRQLFFWPYNGEIQKKLVGWGLFSQKIQNFQMGSPIYCVFIESHCQCIHNTMDKQRKVKKRMEIEFRTRTALHFPSHKRNSRFPYQLRQRIRFPVQWWSSWPLQAVFCTSCKGGFHHGFPQPSRKCQHR